MSARLGQTAIEIGDAIHVVARELAAQTAALNREYSLAVSGRVSEIAFLGELPQPDALRQISDVAQELAAIGSSVLEGALRDYVSNVDYRTISEDIQKALRIGRDARSAGAATTAEGFGGEKEAHFLHHVEDLRSLRDAAEQLVVVAENGDVAVREPGELHAADATATLVAVGLLVVGGLIWSAVA